ncbi:hypothetical protein GcM3_171020, partial [Golovinomyces cichoracearum]
TTVSQKLPGKQVQVPRHEWLLYDQDLLANTAQLAFMKDRPTFAPPTEPPVRWALEGESAPTALALVAATCSAVDEASALSGRRRTASANSTGAAMSSAS